MEPRYRVRAECAYVTSENHVACLVLDGRLDPPVLALDEVGRHIFSSLREPVSCPDIARDIALAEDIEVAEVEKEVRSFVDQLVALGVVGEVDD